LASLPPVLSIAGSDPSGGAGIQQDIKTFTSLGCYGMACVTALTVQNSLGVEDVEPVDADLVARQVKAVLGDTTPVVIKTGMLANAAIVEAVAGLIPPASMLVVDPVMVSTSGTGLLDEPGRDAALDLLFPGATLVTPNIPEAEYLSGLKIEDLSGMKAAALSISERIAMKGRVPALLLKGGHMEGDEKVDLLFHRGEFFFFRHGGKANADVHGTGCLLSSAAAAFLAHGEDVRDAAADAIAFTGRAIEKAFRADSGGMAAVPCASPVS